jgi:hypothetical protein
MSSTDIYGNEPVYYVYAYIRSKDSETAKAGTPYYIGKGKDKRAWIVHSNIKTPENTNNIIVLESSLTELGAFALERRLIKWWGRKNTKTGILCNLTDGGEGCSGLIFNHSNESKEKISNALKGRPAHNKGKNISLETKNKISKAGKGRIVNTDTREKISNALSGHIVSDITRQKISEKVKGKTKGMSRSLDTKQKMKLAAQLRESNYTPEQKQLKAAKIAEKNRGRKQSDEEKLKRANKIRGSKRKTKTCEYCNTITPVNSYARYHGERCKLK